MEYTRGINFEGKTMIKESEFQTFQTKDSSIQALTHQLPVVEEVVAEVVTPVVEDTFQPFAPVVPEIPTTNDVKPIAPMEQVVDPAVVPISSVVAPIEPGVAYGAQDNRLPEVAVPVAEVVAPVVPEEPVSVVTPTPIVEEAAPSLADEYKNRISNAITGLEDELLGIVDEMVQKYEAQNKADHDAYESAIAVGEELLNQVPTQVVANEAPVENNGMSL